MTKTSVCPTVLAYRVFRVAEQHKVPVVMYDYYDNCEYFDLQTWFKRITGGCCTWRYFRIYVLCI